ncbi:MAG: helix-hairpin-helix domain-containing protein [Nocardioides sp.]
MTTHPTLEPATRQGCGGCGRSGAPSGCHCCDTPETCQLECLERPVFTAGMVLSDTDLTALVDWTSTRLGLHRHRDGWGVVCGLDVHCDPDRPGSVVVDPGYAVGCCGEDIVLCEPQTVDLTGCCTVDSPCGEPTKDPKDPQKDRDPCGDVVVDIVLSPVASPAVPELVDTCGCGCGQESHVVTTRLREGGLVEPVCVHFPGADPRQAAAERAQLAYRDCHALLRSWVEAGAKGDASRDDVVAWLRERVVDPPCDWWDTTCSDLAAADGSVQVDAVVAGALFDLVVACRHRLLRRRCDTCEGDRIGLARVWLRRNDTGRGTACVVTRVDAYPPHRRELGHDARPLPAGAEDLSSFVWQRWDQVCPRWRRLAPSAGPLVIDLPGSAGELLTLLDLTDRLWWECGDAAPQPVVVRTRCLGDRVVGFRERKRSTDDNSGLEDVRGIGVVYARLLRESDISTIEELALLEPGAIAKILGTNEAAALAIQLDAVDRVQVTP